MVTPGIINRPRFHRLLQVLYERPDMVLNGVKMEFEYKYEHLNS